MHTWGDGFKYFNEVDAAAYYIGDFCAKWGRIHVTQCKEKYGTVRVYCSLTCDNLQELLFPHYGFIKGPYKLMTFPIFRPLRPLIFMWQKFIYRLAYKKAISKWPMIKKEILCCADWDEYLEGL